MRYLMSSYVCFQTSGSAAVIFLLITGHCESDSDIVVL